MKDFYLEQPTRGIQVYRVRANSKADAERIYEAWVRGAEPKDEHGDPAVEPTSHEVTWSGKARATGEGV